MGEAVLVERRGGGVDICLHELSGESECCNSGMEVRTGVLGLGEGSTGDLCFSASSCLPKNSDKSGDSVGGVLGAGDGGISSLSENTHFSLPQCILRSSELRVLRMVMMSVKWYMFLPLPTRTLIRGAFVRGYMATLPSPTLVPMSSSLLGKVKASTNRNTS